MPNFYDNSTLILIKKKHTKGNMNPAVNSTCTTKPLWQLLSLNFSFCSILEVHVPNSCKFGVGGDGEEAEFGDFFVKDPEEIKKDPHTCFFENQYHAHGSNWTPNYDPCFSCSCQVKTRRRSRCNNTCLSRGELNVSKLTGSENDVSSLKTTLTTHDLSFCCVFL